MMYVGYITAIVKFNVKLRLCDYSDAQTLVKGSITVAGKEAGTENIAADRKTEEVIFKNCVSFPVCISETNNR